MNKQEKIREGIGSRIIDIFCEGIAYGVEKRDGGKAVYTPTERITEFINFLHDNDVVIKVDREWDIGETDTLNIPCNPLCHNMERKLLKEAGYVAVEPLIGGK